MIFFQKLKDNFYRLITKNKIAFPYSEDPNVKRQQIWANLQKGILLEDTGVLIPWNKSFASLDAYAEKRLDSGDRTNWYLGKHVILDGYSCHIEVKKWSFVSNWRRFSRINVWLGHDNEGNKTFLLLREKITNMLGAPATVELEKFGDLDLGVIQWKQNKIEISLVGIEVFNCKYWLHVGSSSRKL